MKLVYSFLFLISLSGLYILQTSASAEIKIYFENELWEQQINPIIVHDRVMFPIREFSDMLDISLDWIHDSKQVQFEIGSTHYVLATGNNKVEINSDVLLIDSPPLIFHNRVYVPVRFIAEQFGFSVYWDETDSSVYLNKAVSKDANRFEFQHILIPDELKVIDYAISRVGLPNDSNNTVKQHLEGVQINIQILNLSDLPIDMSGYQYIIGSVVNDSPLSEGNVADIAKKSILEASDSTQITIHFVANENDFFYFELLKTG